MLELGEPLPFNIYREDGALLLRKGVVLYNQSSIDELCRRESYVSPPGVEGTSSNVAGAEEESPSAARYIEQLIYRIEIAYNNFATNGHNIIKEVVAVATQLVQQLEQTPDALIGIVHLRKDLRYSIIRTLQNTIFAIITARRMHWERKRIVRLACASLTSNLGMYPFQDELNNQQREIEQWQRDFIRKHPVQSVKMLITMGVKDKEWLAMVGFHHERLNGSGYPNRLKAGAINEGARVMGIVDRYGSAISPRAGREPETGQEIMRELLAPTQKEYDRELARFFVTEVGVYPPGVTVQLSNGEIGIVAERRVSRAEPLVAAIWSSQGSSYPQPLMRDTKKPGYGIESFSYHEDAQWLNADALWGERGEEVPLFNRDAAKGLEVEHETEEDITLF